MQQTSLEIFKQKYAFGDEQVPEDSFHRIAYALAEQEQEQGQSSEIYSEVNAAILERKPQVHGLTYTQTYWYYQFLEALQNGAIPAGRISSNIGAEASKPNTSLINCTVSVNMPDTIRHNRPSLQDVTNLANNPNLDAQFKVNKLVEFFNQYVSSKTIGSVLDEAMQTLGAGCGIGYCASSLRPKGAYINGVGAVTSGSLSFMEIYDTMCFTIQSAGGRRGAEMITMHVWHPDIFEFIQKKREVGKFRQFNMSVLCTDAFMEAVKNDEEWNLYFPVHQKEYSKLCKVVGEPDLTSLLSVKDFPFKSTDYLLDKAGTVCKLYKTVRARDLWNLIMQSNYEYAEPGVIFIDRVNEGNPLNCVETIVATNPCGSVH